MDFKFNHIYGPIHSWRLGKSLGIDPLSQSEKVCNMNCIYCQLGKTKSLVNRRDFFVPTEDILYEVNMVEDQDIDYLTFSGRGEPTLARNLGEMINVLHALRKEKIAVITNSTLLKMEDVQKDLSLADVVLAKLDVSCHGSLVKINKTCKGLYFKNIIEGLIEFKSRYRGKFIIQTMFIDQNKSLAKDLAQMVSEIRPDEIHLNTPLRPSASKPLLEKTMGEIKAYFRDIPVLNVYEQERTFISPLNLQQTIKRHGNYQKEPALRR